VSETPYPGEAPDVYLRRIVRDKFAGVAAGLRSEPRSGVLVADTIVVVDEQVLGKPRDATDAERLLRLIVGRTHVVKTRYAIARGAEALPAIERSVETDVTMRRASAREIERYAASGEGLDKAGAYAAQGIGAFLIERISGSYTNVIGLPACEVVLDLQELGLLREFP
jgi:septum formation protein